MFGLSQCIREGKSSQPVNCKNMTEDFPTSVLSVELNWRMVTDVWEEGYSEKQGFWNEKS